ncbi:hypothetical protein ACP70R_023289 [Stipagrostis hirtigluma subsp. patula]
MARDVWANMVDWNFNFLIRLASSLLTLLLRPLVADAVSVGGKIAGLLRAAADYLTRDDTVAGFAALDGGDARPPSQRAPDEPGALTCGDAAAVTARLGLFPPWKCSSNGAGTADRSSECRACGAAEVAGELAGGGLASERELEEAFCVFDRGEDGFICAAELWCVMRRLGFAEGARYEDCEQMIGAFDGDGDGRISFPEFKRMMENAT